MNERMQELGRMGRGKAKRLFPEERERRREHARRLWEKRRRSYAVVLEGEDGAPDTLVGVGKSLEECDRVKDQHKAGGGVECELSYDRATVRAVYRRGRYRFDVLSQP